MPWMAYAAFGWSVSKARLLALTQQIHHQPINILSWFEDNV